MTDEAPDVFTMTPQQATDRLAEIGQRYQAQQSPTTAVAAPPAGVPATTPAQARARLTELKSNQNWRDRLLAGSGQEARQFQELSALAASGDMTDTSIEMVDAVTNPSALRHSHYEGLLDALREQGLPAQAEQFIRAVDSAMARGGVENDLMPSEGDGIAFKMALRRYLQDPEIGKKYLAGDVAVRNQVNNLNRVVALAAQDGQPVSDQAIKILTGLGLR